MCQPSCRIYSVAASEARFGLRDEVWCPIIRACPKIGDILQALSSLTRGLYGLVSFASKLSAFRPLPEAH